MYYLSPEEEAIFFLLCSVSQEAIFIHQVNKSFIKHLLQMMAAPISWAPILGQASFRPLHLKYLQPPLKGVEKGHEQFWSFEQLRLKIH